MLQQVTAVVKAYPLLGSERYNDFSKEYLLILRQADYLAWSINWEQNET